MGGRSASYAHHDLFNFSVPGVTIATDVICGFPTETVEVGSLNKLFYGTFDKNTVPSLGL